MNEEVSKLATELYLSGKCKTMNEAYKMAEFKIWQGSLDDRIKDLFGFK